MNELNDKWKTKADAIFETAKFLQHGTKVDVDLGIAPITTTVDGKFGKRKLHIIRTTDAGLVYVNDMQLLHIVQMANGNFKGILTVEL
jgi:hypothetical protein